MQVGPNPFNEMLIVEMSEGAQFPVDLIMKNKAGEEVLHHRIFTFKCVIDTWSIAPGLYTVYIIDDEREIYREMFVRSH
jgi:hypothetical protein